MITELRTGLILLATLGGYVAVENLIFSTDWYTRFLNPNSGAGYIRLLLPYERSRPKTGPQVLTIGNSRMGFFPFYVNGDPEIGYTFANIAVGGTSPRDWYYMLREVDPTRRAYAAIAIPVESYDDPDAWDAVDHNADLPWIVAQLQFSDIRQFAGSFHSTAARVRAVLGILLKGSVYRADFQDLLSGNLPRPPFREAHRADLDQFGWVSPYPRTLHNVSGVEIDWKAHTIVFPSARHLDEKRFRELLPFPAARPSPTASASNWFKRICDLYRDSPTRIIFFRLPRSPFPPPDEYTPLHNEASSIRILARRPGVTLDDEQDFSSLEDPEQFGDSAHLNVQGSAGFSKMFAHRIRILLGPPPR